MALRVFSRTACASLLLPVAMLLPLKAASKRGSELDRPDTFPLLSATVPGRDINSAQLLAEARRSAQESYEQLNQFVALEQIKRFRGKSNSNSSRLLDTITSVVSYGQDGETYSEIRQNGKSLQDISGSAGAWSEGEYGTLLLEAIKAIDTRSAKFISFAPLSDEQTAVYGFNYTSANSPWEMEVSGRRHLLAFRGQLWVSLRTGRITRLDRIATGVPRETGIAEVNWVVNYGKTDINGSEYWLPTKGMYSVSYLDAGLHEWNEIEFSGYRRYSTEVNIKFN